MSKVVDLGFGYTLHLESVPFIKTPEGKKKIIPTGKKPVGKSLTVYLNAKGKTKEEAEKLVKEGKAKKYTTEELYRMVYPSDDEFYKKFYGYSKRMKKWLEKFYRNKGLIDVSVSSTEKYFNKAEIFETFDNPFSPDPVRVYKLDKGYAIEFAVVSFDDVSIRRFTFKKRPSYQDFTDILSVESVEKKIALFGYPEEFKCWECGKRTHFTEIDAKSLQERISFWEDEYCGC